MKPQIIYLFTDNFDDHVALIAVFPGIVGALINFPYPTLISRFFYVGNLKITIVSEYRTKNLPINVFYIFLPPLPKLGEGLGVRA
jgi:hypothetical protein